MNQKFELLRQDEAKLVIDSTEDDLVVNQLMNLTYFHLIKLWTSGERLLGAALLGRRQNREK